jgi:hypothetical protein
VADDGLDFLNRRERRIEEGKGALRLVFLFGSIKKNWPVNGEEWDHGLFENPFSDPPSLTSVENFLNRRTPRNVQRKGLCTWPSTLVLLEKFG